MTEKNTSIKKINLVEAVRLRPGMYFGSPEDALCHLLCDLIRFCLGSGANEVTLFIHTPQTFLICTNRPLVYHDEFKIKVISAACPVFALKTKQGELFFLNGQPTAKENGIGYFKEIPENWDIALTINMEIFPKFQQLNLLKLAALCKPMVLLSAQNHIILQSPKQTHHIHYPCGLSDRLAEISAFRTSIAPFVCDHLENEQGHCAIALGFARTGKHYVELFVNDQYCVAGGTMVDDFIKQLQTHLNPDCPYILAVIQLHLDTPKFDTFKEKLIDSRGNLLVNSLIEKLIPLKFIQI